MSEDAETHQVRPAQLGGPVDPPPEHRTLYATVMQGADQPARPILPGWLRNPDQRRAAARVAARTAAHRTGYHASRSPKYVAKVAIWAPVGMFRGLYRALRWTYDLESWGIRQAAATRGATDEYLALSRHRDARVGRRLWVAAPAAVLLTIAVILLLTAAPGWLRWLALAVAVPTLAWIGRPADRPILDRVTSGPTFTRLTAEQVRGALCSIGLARIREPGDLSFPPPGIHRDGPGWLARVNLPAGVEVYEVLERRGRLSSALRLPVDQVWPTAGPEHAGQLDLWVGYLPASKMGQPRWSLAASDAVTSIFAEQEFGTDERQRPVRTPLFARNFLIGGVPGSGKSYGARTLALIAALDPTCEMKIAEFKGTADFGDLAHLCSTYVCGVDDQALSAGADIVAWGLAEAERRGARIRAARERGEAPEGKVTPELAARPGSGLHPVLILIDEAHELLCNKDVAADAERLIKRGRALGLIIVLATQVPDRTSVPPNITRCVTVRWCMAVQDQVANDMILGTGAYKRGLTATAYRPGEDAGWGIATGLSQAGPVRSHYPSQAQTKAIVARATALRGGVVGTDVESAPTRDVLEDVIRVFATFGRPGMHWAELVAALAEQYPQVYGRHTAESLSALVRAAGIESVNVKAPSGQVAKGCRRDAVTRAVAAREVTDGR